MKPATPWGSDQGDVLVQLVQDGLSELNNEHPDSTILTAIVDRWHRWGPDHQPTFVIPRVPCPELKIKRTWLTRARFDATTGLMFICDQRDVPAIPKGVQEYRPEQGADSQIAGDGIEGCTASQLLKINSTSGLRSRPT
jgi:hypothetical protein